MPVKKVGSVFALFLFFTGLAGAVPAGFNIQGRLTDMNGVNRDGTYQMTFSVFPVETEGTALWEQDFSLSVKNGNFQVILQGLDKNNKLLEDKVKNLERAYVEITVSGEAPMVPRQLLLRSPFASSDKMVGAVMFFAGNICPNGWLRVDGSTLPTTGTYSELFSYIGYTYGGSGDNFVLPNMSDGSFVRATGGNAANIGIKQMDAFQGHQHRMSTYQHTGKGFNLASGNYPQGPDVKYTDMTITDSVYGNVRVASETRPQNYAMIPCIKF